MVETAYERRADVAEHGCDSNRPAEKSLAKTLYH